MNTNAKKWQRVIESGMRSMRDVNRDGPGFNASATMADSKNWHFYTDRDTIGQWKRLYVAKDLIEELKRIKEKFEKEQISLEVRVNHSNLQLN